MADNFLLDTLNYFARYAGGYGQLVVSPHGGSPFFFDPSSDRILAESQYMGYKGVAAEADYTRRIRSIREYVTRYWGPGAGEAVDAFEPLIRMLLKSDTPEIRQKIRESAGPLGGAILEAFDIITNKEIGYDRIYAGAANTMGSPIGNAAAARASNLFAALEASEENKTASGYGRKFSAGMVGATLALKQERGFNFETELGPDIADYNSIFTDQISREDNASALKAARVSYIDTQLTSGNWNETDKKILEQIRASALSGSDLYSNLNEFVGDNKAYKTIDAIKNKFNIDSEAIKHAQINQAYVIEDTITRDMETKGDVYKAFQEFAKKEGLIEPGKNADAAELKVYEAKKQAVLNKFVNQIISGEFTGNLGVSDTTDFLKVVSASNSELGETNEKIQRLLRSVIEEGRLRQSVGQAMWSSLSTEEQQRYKDRYGDVGTAQTYLGSEAMDQFAHASMAIGDEDIAANTTQLLLAAEKRAGISHKDMTQQYAFIGSIMRNKNLAEGVAITSAAWQASAKTQGIELSPEQRMTMGQRFARIKESVQGSNVAMFLTQHIDPNSKLGKLQAALRTGTMTAEQQKQWNEYMDNQDALINDIAAATGKNPGVLREEARHNETNWYAVDEHEQANVLNAMNRSIITRQTKDLISEDRLKEHFRELSTPDLQAMGASGKADTKFQNMLFNVTQSGLVDPRKWVTGEISDKEIAALEKAGYKDEAQVARKRSEEFNAKFEELKKTKSPGEARRAARIAMGDTEVNRAFDKFFGGDHERTKNLSMIGVNISDTDMANTVATDARYNQEHQSVAKKAKDKTPEEAVADAMGASPKGLEEFNNSYIMGPLKAGWDAVTGLGKAAAKRLFGSGGGTPRAQEKEDAGSSKEQNKASGKESSTGSNKVASDAISEIARAIRENKELRDAITDLFKPAADNLAKAVEVA